MSGHPVDRYVGDGPVGRPLVASIGGVNDTTVHRARAMVSTITKPGGDVVEVVAHRGVLGPVGE